MKVIYYYVMPFYLRNDLVVQNRNNTQLQYYVVFEQKFLFFLEYKKNMFRTINYGPVYAKLCSEKKYKRMKEWKTCFREF